jgi:hypothetical protein
VIWSVRFSGFTYSNDQVRSRPGNLTYGNVLRFAVIA